MYKVSLSRGSIIHFVTSFLLVLLNELIILLSVSILYSTYQYLDYKSGEDPNISQWNLIEFIGGAVIGLLFRLLIVLFIGVIL